MKRTVAIVAGVVTLGLALYVGSRLTAQTGAPADAGRRHRPCACAWSTCSTSSKTTNAWTRSGPKTRSCSSSTMRSSSCSRTPMDGRTKQLQDPQFADKREALEKEVKRLQREIQEKTEDARVALDKKQGETIVLVYRELDEAVRTYARQSNLELVLHYNDAVLESDKNSATNIARKMTAGACMPMYMLPSAGHQPGHRQRAERQVSGADLRPGGRQRHALRRSPGVFSPRPRTRGSGAGGEGLSLVGPKPLRPTPLPGVPGRGEETLPLALLSLSRMTEREKAQLSLPAHSGQSGGSRRHRLPDRRERVPALCAGAARHRRRLCSHRSLPTRRRYPPTSIRSPARSGGPR